MEMMQNKVSWIIEKVFERFIITQLIWRSPYVESRDPVKRFMSKPEKKIDNHVLFVPKAFRKIHEKNIAKFPCRNAFYYKRIMLHHQTGTTALKYQLNIRGILHKLI